MNRVFMNRVDMNKIFRLKSYILGIGYLFVAKNVSNKHLNHFESSDLMSKMYPYNLVVA